MTAGRSHTELLGAGDTRVQPVGAVRRQGTARLTLHTFTTTVASNVALGGVSIVLARALGPSGKGAYDLIVATAALLSTLCGLSLPAGITYTVARRRVAVRRLLRRVVRWSVAQAVLAAGFLAVIRLTPLAPAFVPPAMDASVALASFVFVGLTLLQSVSRAVLAGRQEIVLANRLEFLGRATHLGLFLLALLAMTWLGREPHFDHFVWLAALSIALPCALAFRSAHRDAGEPPAATNGFGEVLRYALTCHLGNIAQFLNYRVSVFLVGFFLGTASVGLYTLAMTLSQLHWLLAQAAGTVLLPVVASQLSVGNDDAIHVAKVTRAIIAVTAALALVTASVAGPFVPWVFGAEFEGSVRPLFLLLPGSVAFVPSIVLASYFGGHGRPAVNLKGSAMGLMTVLVLGVILVPRLGIAGAAIATSGAYLVSSVVLVLAFSRSARIATRDVVVPRPGDGVRLLRAVADRFEAGSRREKESTLPCDRSANQDR